MDEGPDAHAVTMIYERDVSRFVEGVVWNAWLCVERREAFFLGGQYDPTLYDDSAPSLEAMIRENWRIPA